MRLAIDYGAIAEIVEIVSCVDLITVEECSAEMKSVAEIVFRIEKLILNLYLNKIIFILYLN